MYHVRDRNVRYYAFTCYVTKACRTPPDACVPEKLVSTLKLLYINRLCYNNCCTIVTFLFFLYRFGADGCQPAHSILGSGAMWLVPIDLLVAARMISEGRMSGSIDRLQAVLYFKCEFITWWHAFCFDVMFISLSFIQTKRFCSLGMVRYEMSQWYCGQDQCSAQWLGHYCHGLSKKQLTQLYSPLLVVFILLILLHVYH